MTWTTPKTWAANDVLTAADLNTHLRDNLTAASEWTSYTPLWTATGGTPTVGNGSLTGRYIIAGSLCHVSVLLGLGTTSHVGTTTLWRLSLPVAATGFAVLPVFAHDLGTAYYMGLVNVASGATVVTAGLVPGTANQYGYEQPFTWTPANGDYLHFSGSYEC